MISLNRENCFNTLAKVYPEDMKRFGAWLSDYMSKIGMDPASFSSLPIEMQVGVLLRFTAEVYATDEQKAETLELFLPSYWVKSFSEVFSEVNFVPG